MRHTYLILLLALVLGCAERNDPVQIVPEASAFNLISQTETPGWAMDLWVEGDTAYIADGEFGVSIFDISDLSAPNLIRNLHLGIYNDARKVIAASLDSHPIIIVNTKENLQVFNAETGAYISFLGSRGISDVYLEQISADSFHIGITDYSDDGYGYSLLYYDDAIDFWSLRDYQNFYRSGVGYYRGLHVNGNKTYLAHSQAGLSIVEVDYLARNVTSVLGNVDTPGSAYDITMNGDKTHVIIADYQSGIQIINVTDPSAPAIVGSLLPDRVDQVIKVEAVGDTVYFIDEHSAMFAADVSDPSNPILLGSYETPEPSGFFITEDHTIFLTDEDLGLLILEWQE